MFTRIQKVRAVLLIKSAALVARVMLAGAVVFGGAGDVFGQTLYVPLAYQNAPILRFTPGGGSNVFAQGFATPVGLAQQAGGGMYVLNYGTFGQGSIITINPSGVVSPFAVSGVSRPTGIAVDASGTVYVANDATGSGGGVPVTQIVRFNSSGQPSVFATTGGVGAGDLAFDGFGNLYLANNVVRGSVLKYTPDGTMSVFCTAAGLGSPQSLAFDQQGNLWVGEAYTGVVEKFSSSGISLGIMATDVGSPTGLAFDAARNLYVTDYGFQNTGRLLQFSPTGNMTVIAQNLIYPSAIMLVPEPGTVVLLPLLAMALVAFRSRRFNLSA